MHACMSRCVTALVSSNKACEEDCWDCCRANIPHCALDAPQLIVLCYTQVTDCKPKRPNWGMLSGGEVHSTTIAAWGHLVLLGDADGNLNKWDTTTSVPPALCLLP